VVQDINSPKKIGAGFD